MPDHFAWSSEFVGVPDKGPDVFVFNFDGATLNEISSTVPNELELSYPEGEIFHVENPAGPNDAAADSRARDASSSNVG